MPDDLPSPETIHALLDVIAPGSTLTAILPVDGSYSNFTNLAEYESAPGEPTRIIVRRYNPASPNVRRKARVEFHALKLLEGHDVPTAKPIYLDEDGAILGLPGIVTSFMPGKQIEAHPDNPAWAREAAVVAKVLAKIHAIPYDDTAKSFLLDGNQECVWFLKPGAPPVYMSAHPDGARVWQAVHDLFPHRQPVEPILGHTDYWSGNILWDAGRISAIVDWEEAAYGDPGVDVAYCRMEMFLEGMDAEADEFLRVYEAESGQTVANLGLWELAAAARPMTDINGWMTTPLMPERFHRFIHNALQRAGYTSTRF